MKTLSILGSTGSIGVNALDVVAAHREEFSILALAAGRNIELLAAQIDRFHPRLVAVLDAERAAALRRRLGPGSPVAVRDGAEGYREAAAMEGVEMVVSAMVGAAGLLPTLTAIEAGKAIALANKETLVMAGSLVLQAAADRGVEILPVDSEHSAIFQCLEGQRRETVRRIILTASGGPFLTTGREELAKATPEMALKHPNWTMGAKITIDSATMMNKGLEVIEAHWLFGLPLASIEVIVHPQSIVHSLVEFHDGSVLAQLGTPDMRLPIAYALAYPRRLARPEPKLDLLKAGTLTFVPPDRERFPALELAYRAAEAGGTMPAVLNGANECAVAAFVGHRIGFGAMAAVVAETLKRHRRIAEPRIEEIVAADQWARQEAEAIIAALTAGRVS